MFVKDIRKQLQTQLNIHKFVETVENSEISIIENNKNAKLKQVNISNLPYEKSKIWRINLENYIQGLSTANKSGELALAILKNKYLNVYLIELKSMIKDQTLKGIKEKIQDSISRFYFLMSINSDENHEIFKNLKIRFIALVFFNGNDKTTSTTDPNLENIYEVFKNRGGKIVCNTILDKGLIIPVKFFSENFDKSTGIMKMDFNYIEKEIQNIRGSFK